MQISRPNAKSLTSEDRQQLDQLKSIVENALANGKLSKEEIIRIQKFSLADSTIVYEQRITIRQTMQRQLGDAELEYEWS